MALHNVPTEACGGRHGSLTVDAISHLKTPKIGAEQGFWRNVHTERAAMRLRTELCDSEAYACVERWLAFVTLTIGTV